MEIRAEDFPLYQLLAKLGMPGIERATNEFNKAVTGGDEERYRFALGIQTVAHIPNPESHIKGFTKEIKDKTMRSCLAVFEDVASRGHEKAAFMAVYFRKHYGVGNP